MPYPTTTVHITRVTAGVKSYAQDTLAAEEPLELRITYNEGNKTILKNISVTMRTPGNDEELAIGFLFTEGIITLPTDVAGITRISENIVLVTLAEGIVPVIKKLDRNFYTTSSCGVCGKASIDAIKTYSDTAVQYPYDQLQFTPAFLCTLPGLLRTQQSVFELTGGIHACALFDAGGNLVALREDVGRHNALDKLIGYLLSAGMYPADAHVLLLSGRASFELVQKAAMAGIKVIAAVGAPSSLAVQMTEEWNITLIGFLRNERFNIYSGAQRVAI
ncbi:MAG: formate dehydrogenase accessory sulfurtransferase FdhD [Taibaiella sp.]|nr:formate dehydrogenase accessory sulfurtransferase FdhD [Taibaiella sp.]